MMTLLTAFLLTCYAWVQEGLHQVQLPESTHPVELYETHADNNIGTSLINAIRASEKSIVIAVYSLTDQKIIEALNHQAEQGVSVKVIYDASTSSNLDKKLVNKVTLIRRFDKGLMHLKLLVIDEKQTWIGSANFSYESLYINTNLMMAFEGEELAQYVLKKIESIQEFGTEPSLAPQSFLFDGQQMEFWFLPDNPQASTKIKQLIQGAKKSIRVAMYTFTRQDFANALVDAQRRGVKVEVALDCAQSRCKNTPEVIDFLQNNHVPLRISTVKPLLHYKYMVIDDQILVNGSANWTKKAFNENKDCFVILQSLTPEQIKFMNQVWNQILRETK